MVKYCNNNKIRHSVESESIDKKLAERKRKNIGYLIQCIDFILIGIANRNTMCNKNVIIVIIVSDRNLSRSHFSV